MSLAPVVERSIEIKASPSTVWSLVSTEEGLRQWFDRTIEIEMKVGSPFKLREEESQGAISGYVLEIIPQQRVVLSWLEKGWVHPTRLTITLEETAYGTRVSQRYDGFAGIGRITWERAYHAYDAGIDRHGLLPALKQLAESFTAA